MFHIIMPLMKGIISLIFFSAHCLFVYWKSTDISKLVMYSVTSVNISCVGSMVELLGLFLYTTKSSENNGIVAYSFPIYIPLSSLFVMLLD